MGGEARHAVAAQDDVGATASSTNSPDGANDVQVSGCSSAHEDDAKSREDPNRLHDWRDRAEIARVTAGETAPHSPSQAIPSKPAMKTGEAPSSSQASPVADFDPVRDIPSFMRRTDKGCMASGRDHDDINAVRV